MFPQMQEDEQGIERWFGHLYLQTVEHQRLTFAHSVALHTCVTLYVQRMSHRHGHPMHLDGHAVRNEVIVLIMIEFLIELKGVGESLAHRSTRRMILIFAHKQVYVSPLPQGRLGIEGSQTGTFHQHRTDACFGQCRPCLL